MSDSAKRWPLAVAAAAMLLGALPARSDGLQPLAGAVGETRPILDLRLRYESVDQDPPPALLTESADALTLRVRAGFETGKAWSTALLAEGSFAGPLSGSYRQDNAVPARDINRPVIADPEIYQLNRLQLVNTALPGTTITLGRQRINLDDQRFVGNVGWRQTEQTYDALRVVNKSIPNLTVDLTYLNKVHRVFGPDSPQGTYRGDVYLGNLAYQLGNHKLSAFAYLVGLESIVVAPGAGVTAATATALNPARAATSTYGLRAAGEWRLARLKLGYVGSWATQSDRGANPLALRNDYFLGELSATYKAYTLTFGDEVLQGDGTAGFSTPLATLHKFQGWADKFLVTPANGIDDRYVGAGVTWKGVGWFDTVGLNAVWHDYHTQRLSLDYGSEWNLLASAKWRRYAGLLKYARYATGTNSSTVAGYGDTSKFWAQIEMQW